MRPPLALALIACHAPGSPEVRPGDPASDPPDHPPGDTIDAPDDTDPSVDPPAVHPGAFAVRRLNRDEYDRTVRDLLGTDQRPGRTFPPEARSSGFDTVAEALTVNPAWLDLADRAAASLAAEATRPPLPAPWSQVIEGESGAFVLGSPDVGGPEGGELALRHTGTAFVGVAAPVAGTWTLTFRLRAEHLYDEPLRYAITVDGVTRAAAELPATVAGPIDVSVDAPIGADGASVALSFDNDAESAAGDRNLFLDRLTVSGPVDWSPEPTEPYRRVMICDLGPDPRGCARAALEGLAPRAWRRPVAPDEIDGLLGVYDAAVALGEDPQGGIEAAVHAVLVSPDFLLIVEPASAEPTPVGDHELAARLSYFLWGSMPDDVLRALADAGALRDDATLDAQVDRMLADPRADVLVTSFAAQWLGMDLVDAINVDARALDWWTPGPGGTRDAMRGEMEALFRTFLTTDRPMSELLTTREAWADPTLAGYLGVPAPAGDGFGAYDGERFNRGGWLTQAGLLMALSHPDRTSPVKRGAWVLDALLCAPPPPPPAGIPALGDTEGSPANLREQLAAHRANPGCAVCHDDIDPIGLALERYDELGRYRPREGTAPVDATGGLPGGPSVDGAFELEDAIAADPAFDRCVAEKVFTWSHHRAPAGDDDARVDALTAAWVADGRALRSLLRAVVHTDSFRMRQAPP